MASGGKLVSVDFEIFGRVQGVFFRQNTKKTAKKLGLVGWVLNSETGTVQGSVQGPEKKIDEMKVWLSTKGSRQSKIEKANFTNEKPIEKLEYKGFVVRDDDD